EADVADRLGAGLLDGRLGGVAAQARAVDRGRGPALLAREPQPRHRGVAAGAALVGAAVLEAGEHARHLLEGHYLVGAAGGRDVTALEDRVDDRERRLRRLVVEELPVDH